MPDWRLLVPGRRVSLGKCAQCSVGTAAALGRQEGSATAQRRQDRHAQQARPGNRYAKHRCQGAGCSVVAGVVKAYRKRFSAVSAPQLSKLELQRRC